MAVFLTISTPLKIVRGDTIGFDLEITDDSGDMMDLTGLSVGLYIVDKDDLSSVVLEKVQSSHVDAVNGRTAIVLSSTETRQLRSDKQYFYEFKLFDGSGFVKTLGSGIIVVFNPVKML